MFSVEDRYYKINRILLKAIGIWPYQTSKWTHVQALIITIIYLSALFVQLAVFITHECTLKIMVDVLSFVFPTIFMLFMYDLYYFNIDVLKEILDHMYYHWKFVKSEEEYIILNDYANTAKLFTQVFLFLASIAIFVAIMSHVMPLTLDFLLPLNETRAQNLHIIVEYFVVPSDHYLLLITHLTVFICLGCLTIMATALMLLGIGFHTCALFKLANYRMEIIMDQTVLRILDPEKEQLIHRRMIYAVNIHRRAFEFVYVPVAAYFSWFCELLVINLEKWFLIIIIIGVISLSVNLLRFLQALPELNIIDVFIPTALIFAHFCYLFFGNHIGQQVTSHNDDIFNTIYNLPWYIAPLNIQKLFLFLLRKGSKSFYLSIQGLFDASYQGFTTLTTTSISYFTVLYSIQ